MKTKECPACNNPLVLPKEYFEAIRKTREETEAFIPVIRKDLAINVLEKSFCGLSRAEYRKFFVESLPWKDFSEYEVSMLQKMDKIIIDLIDIADT